MRTSSSSLRAKREAQAAEDDNKRRCGSSGHGRLFIVGIGPGALQDMTERAVSAIKASDSIVGYKTYVDLLGSLIKRKKVYSSGMMQEIERAKFAIGLAKEGQRVSLISSGDSGIYGMAGIALELLKDSEVAIEVIPGVTAASSAAASLGAPLMNDFAAISLSDLMTKWPDIKRRLEAAARADFVTALYNPKSTKRIHQLEDAQRIFLKYRKPTTPVGIVKNSGRVGEVVIRTTLKDMLKHDIDMTTIVIIGNSQTFIKGKWMVTPRGYNISVIARSVAVARRSRSKPAASQLDSSLCSEQAAQSKKAIASPLALCAKGSQ